MKITLDGIILLEAAFKPLVNPLGTTAPGKPPSDVQIDVELFAGDEPNTHAVKLRVNVESPGSPFTVAVTYATLLRLDLEGQQAPDNLENRLIVTGASIAFPFVREVVSHLTTRGRFGSVLLGPVNFNTVIPKMQEEATAATK